MALTMVSPINVTGDNSLMYEVADIKTWANLGLYFAEKLRGATALQTFRREGGEEYRKTAITHLENALQYWDVVIGITRPIYKDMPLVHFTEQNGVRTKENDQLRFHWEKLRPAVAHDIEIAKNAAPKSVQ